MPIEQSFVANLTHLTRGLQTAFDAHLKSMGLTTQRGRVLLYLSRHADGANQADLTEFLRVEHPTAVRIIDGLETLGYVKRLPAPNDRRAKIIALTEVGRPLADKVLRMTKQLNDIVMQGVDADELDCVTRVMGKLLVNTALLNQMHIAEGGVSL